MSKKSIDSLLEKLKITTLNKKIYLEAMTHSSFINEISQPCDNKKNYEKLEILGDAIVSKIVIEYFYKEYPDFSEVEINDAKKLIVQGRTMAKASEELNLIDYAQLGNGIDLVNGVQKIKEDLFESLIGAIYIDQGEAKCFDLIKQTLIKYYLNDELHENIDYKTKIQEIFQSPEYQKKGNKENKIFYKEIDTLNNIYKIQLVFNNIVYGEGNGKTKKEAQQNAARDAYKKLA